MAKKKHKFWVTATDSFMSGWGRADKKDNKLIIPVETHAQATEIKKVLLGRSEMKRVNICINKPRYDKRYILAQEKGYSNVKNWKTDKKLAEKRLKKLKK